MKTKRLTLKLFKDKRGEFRWTLIASNGRKLSDGGEGYKRRRFMEKAILLTLCGAEPFQPAELCKLAEVRPDIIVRDEITKAK